MKRSYKLLLPSLLFSNLAFAQPFSTLDTRSMAMGDTGVASANAGSAALFNPALLSEKNTDQSVHIILPNIGLSAFADPDAVDSITNIEDEEYFDNISDSIDAMDTALANNTPDAFIPAKQKLTSNTNSLNNDLNELNEKPFRINAGGFFSVSVPSKTLGVSVFANANATIETTPDVDECDSKIMSDYTSFLESFNTQGELEDIAEGIIANGDPTPQASCNTNGDSIDIITVTDDGMGNVDSITFNNPVEDNSGNGYDLSSSVFIAGVTISEVGIALSHQFDIGGQAVSFGITPKLQTITSYHATPTTQELDDDNYDLADELEASEQEDSAFNLDLGIATSFLANDALTVGLTLKNLIPATYETSVSDQGKQYSFDIDLLAKAGISWSAPYGLTVAADLDLTKNKPLFIGEDTQFLGAGLEWNMFNIMRLRGGMRTNLADSDDSVITAGLGFNIVVVHIDLGAQFSENNAGAALQIGMNF